MPLTRYAPTHPGNRPTPSQRPDPTTVESIIEFGRFRVLPRRRELLADGQPIELGARAFDILLALIEANGSLVTKEELLNRVWPARIVEENNLTVQILALRKAFGGDRRLIRTDYGRGYRFLAACAQAPLEAPASRMTHESRRRDRPISHGRLTQCAPWSSPVSDATDGTGPASARGFGGNDVSDGFDPRSRWQMQPRRATDRWLQASPERAGRAVA
jgi:DNA-binding winged helix-turn-helix (wHTH) protein